MSDLEIGTLIPPGPADTSGVTRPKSPPLSAESNKLLADTWTLATPNGPSPYLVFKGVGTFGTASTPSGALYVPMRDQSGELKNLQRLEAPDASGKTKGPENSLLIKDSAIDGLHHVIGDVQPGKPIVFSADYADAAAIHQSTGLPTVVTFSDANTPAVVDQYLDKAISSNSKLVLHVKHQDGAQPSETLYVALAASPNVQLLVAGGTQKIEGFEGFSGKSLSELMQQFGGKAVKSLVDEALIRTQQPDSNPTPTSGTGPSAIDPKVSWTGPWQKSDDGLSAVRQVVGQVAPDSGYLAGFQKLNRGVETKPQWEDELFPKFPEAELRSKLLANRAMEAEAAKPAQQAETGTVEKIKGDDLQMASDVDGTLLKLKSQYLLAENKFYFRDNTKTLAFEDAGKKVKTEHESPEVIRSMIELSKSKGWSEVKLTGTDTFKRRAWVEAELLEIKTQGYTPDDFDRNELKQRQATALADAPQKNTVEQVVSPSVTAATETPADLAGATPNELASRYGTRLAKELQNALAGHGHAPESDDTNQALDYVAGLATSPRVFVGKLLDHGPAPYEFKEKGTPNYFVKIETQYGEKTVWGVDIPRALAEGKGSTITTGDDILLAFQGSKPVSVHNELTGETVQSHRNTWYADKVADLPAVARSADDKPTYSTTPRDSKPRNTGADAKQQMLASVLQQKGAPQDAINKALAATTAIPRPVATSTAPTTFKPSV